ncbi:MAG TPA: ribosomal protein S18-alanine N-acetyltransferase [Armatimonadota bacterium]
MTLRAMREADLDALMEVERACFSSHWSREALMNELGNSCAFYVVGVCAGKLVGYGGEWIIMDEAHITNIAVHPTRHGQRFGERLLIALLREARYRGARRATLEVRVSNAVALRLYQKYGFETVAIRRKYYQDTDEDALVMWVNDLFSPRVSELLNQRFRGD